MAEHDPDGLYATLGVQPSATPALIKAAYRVRAMELHPDRNAEAGATFHFQALQHAFEVLSDTDKRTAYDADAAIQAKQVQARAARERAEQTEKAQAAATQAAQVARTAQTARDAAAAHVDSSVQAAAAEPVWGAAPGVLASPIRCSRCDTVPLLPRYRRFVEVRGFLFETALTRHEGIFCAGCEVATAFKATSVSLLLGWWSVAALLRTPPAVLGNLVGGPPQDERDARLLAAQAMHFASMQRLDVARAIATQAHRLVARLRGPRDLLESLRAKLGRRSADPRRELAEHLAAFLNSTSHTRTAPLRGTWRFWNARLLLQLVPCLLFAGLLVAVIRTTLVVHPDAPAPHAQTQDAAHPAGDPTLQRLRVKP